LEDRAVSAAAEGSALPVRYDDVASAARLLAGVCHRTPVVTSHTVDERVGAHVFFKCENLQRAGSFKFRGAYNALMRLAPEQKRRGVVAYSSGNHAQAVALAGQLLRIPAVIVMPRNAPQVKANATRGYGAEIVFYDRGESREAIAERLARERGLAIGPSFDHPDIVAGQGTAAKELIEEVGLLDYLFVPCGGAGLLSGSAIAARKLAPGAKVIGVEPAAGDDATRSFRTRELQTVMDPDTIADGARTSSLGKITFPLVLEYVSDMVTVTDAELLSAMFFLWERLKLVVEPTGALGAAAVFEGKADFRGARVGVILSGGNADFRELARLL
jgi:threo-3-hydroxy-L-aspartate ammonia-lyase